MSAAVGTRFGLPLTRTSAVRFSSLQMCAQSRWSRRLWTRLPKQRQTKTPTTNHDLACAADYVIVGSGPAASACAAGLLRHKPEARVCMLERGPPPPQSPPTFVEHSPAALHAFAASSRRLAAPATRQHIVQAAVGGGGSVVNAMIWCSPTRADVAAALGADFEARHRSEFAQEVEARLAAPYPETAQAFWDDLLPGFQAQAADGDDAAEDARGKVVRTMVSCRDEQRQLATSLLEDAAGEGSSRLATVFHADARHVVFDSTSISSSKRPCAVGVETADGRCYAAREGVVLAAGAIETPALLMRSGVGPAEELDAAGIDVRVDQPHVGRHLSDHVLLNDYALLEPDSAPHSPPMPFDMPYQLYDGAGNAVQLSRTRVVGDVLAYKLFYEYRYPAWRLVPHVAAGRQFLRVQLKLFNEGCRGRVRLAASGGAGVGGLQCEAELDLQATLEWFRGNAAAVRAQLEGLLAETQAVVGGSTRLRGLFTDRMLADPARYLWSGYHYAGTCGVGKVLEEEDMAVRGVSRLHVADTSAANITSTGNSQALAYFCGTAAGARI